MFWLKSSANGSSTILFLLFGRALAHSSTWLRAVVSAASVRATMKQEGIAVEMTKWWLESSVCCVFLSCNRITTVWGHMMLHRKWKMGWTGCIGRHCIIPFPVQHHMSPHGSLLHFVCQISSNLFKELCWMFSKGKSYTTWYNFNRYAFCMTSLVNSLGYCVSPGLKELRYRDGRWRQEEPQEEIEPILKEK